ncbi:MAG: replication-relaxation family protein, partial [Chloroflexi bacterium]|nr:replication-relaxation family protein [Chloroflexota bacterium]
MSARDTLSPTLGWLLVWPWLSSSQLGVLLDQDPATVRRRLHRARQAGLVQAIAPGRPGLPGEQIYALTDAGLAHLAARQGTLPRALARRHGLSLGALYDAVNRLDQVYAVRGFVLGLLAAARARGDAVLEGQTFVQRRYQRGKTGRTFTADAYVVYQRGEVGYPFFLLYDRGGLPLEALRDAVAAYLRYRESGSYRGPYYHFPALAVVLADPERLVELRFRGRALGYRLGVPPPQVVLTTRAELGAADEAGPLAAIWRAGDSYDVVGRLPLLRVLGGVSVGMGEAPAAALPLPEPGETTAPVTGRTVRVLGAPLAERAQRLATRPPLGPRSRPAVLEERAALWGVALAPAAQAVLDLVSRIGYLAPAHVAAVQGTGAEMARRHLRALEDLGAVMAWVPGEPGYPPLYCPTRLAVYRLARQRGLTPRRAARVSQEHPDPGDNDLARHLAHTVRVRDFFAHCYEAARAAGGELVAWQGESECEQRFLWQGAVQYLRPDGYGQLRLGGTVWPFYLEWDHGREWVPRYRDKFAAYYDCRASRAPYAI